MIRSGNSTRFTPHEVGELRQVGLDLANVKCQNDLDVELTRWAYTLAGERFDLLEQIASQTRRGEVASPSGQLIFCSLGKTA
jgi:hypothetical protein